MNYLLLIVAIFVLLFALKKISMVKYNKVISVLKEVKQNVVSMLWGLLVFAAIIFLPYQVWALTESSHYWDGVFIIGGTVILTITVSFIFYYKTSVKSN